MSLSKWMNLIIDVQCTLAVHCTVNWVYSIACFSICIFTFTFSSSPMHQTKKNNEHTEPCISHCENIWKNFAHRVKHIFNENSLEAFGIWGFKFLIIWEVNFIKWKSISSVNFNAHSKQKYISKKNWRIERQYKFCCSGNESLEFLLSDFKMSWMLFVDWMLNEKLTI